MKHILILGAGFMQKPAFEAARELGCFITAADGNPNACCAALADRFEPIDLKDTEKLLALAYSMRAGAGIDGVFTAGTDFSAAVARIAQELRLPGHSYEAALDACDKIRMRSRFAAAGVPSPRFFCADASFLNSGAEQLLAASGFDSDSFPLVVKPADNMGARGCRMVCSADDLLPALKDAVGYSRTQRAVIEEYMDGREFSIDALVYNGKITITGFADRHIFYPPYFIEMGHTMPTDIDPETYNALAETFRAGVRALGLTCGAAKGDVKLTKNGPMIGEIAARLSGGYMSGWTYPLASGVPLTALALRIALGLELPAELSGTSLPCEKYSAERAWVSVPGKVLSVHGLEAAAAVPSVREVFPRSNPGDAVCFPRSNVEKCGNVIACAETRHDAVLAAEKACALILLRLAPDNPSTDAFLRAPLSEHFPPPAFRLPESDAENFSSWLKSAESAGTRLSASVPPEKQIPPMLFAAASSLRDWNGRTMRQTLEQFSSFFPESGCGAFPAAAFWKALVRGGIQGILYIADTISARGGSLNI
ncbi:MAG: ATP-grasp domain-containing protein [Bacteroides sp.]|nr:ATP-grasp domain-containing protein [Prevotella sp.]MCM1407799.1 ATP-grasp domain-containing protein [Treponema brennaborense]MCM1468853.1 ATP-grasp domain-containing protein [Bacteroides sp.]